MTYSSLVITDIDVIKVAVPMAGGGFRNAYATYQAQQSIIVRVRSGDRVGVGNVDPLPGYSTETIDQSIDMLARKLIPAVLGQDACAIRQIGVLMDEALPGFMEAKAAIDMACVDLITRSWSVPAYSLLGGTVKSRVRLNGWIGIVSPEQAAREAMQWKSAGFGSAKIKLGGDIRADHERVRAVRDAVGDDMELRADANACYSVQESIALGRLLEPYRLQLLEQPVAAHDVDGLAQVRKAIGIPIMADESITDHQSLIDVIRANAADVVKLKIMKQGGMIRCRDMMETASAAGMQIVIGHGFGLSINTQAEIMLAATSTDVLDGLECVGPLKMLDDVTTEQLDLGQGYIDVPACPGLGLVLDNDKLTRYTL